MFCPNEKSLRTAIQFLLKRRWPASFNLQMGQHHLVVKKDIAPVSGFPHWVSEVLSRVWLFATQWTVSHQAPASMGFSKQEYWSGLPFPSPVSSLDKVKKDSRLVVSDSVWPHGLWLTSILCPRNSPGKNTGLGCHSLLQGIFPTQGSNLCLLHCRQILYHLSYQGSPILYSSLDN